MKIYLTIIHSIRKPLYSEIESYSRLHGVALTGYDVDIIYKGISTRNHLLIKYAEKNAFSPYLTKESAKATVSVGLQSIRALARK